MRSAPPHRTTAGASLEIIALLTAATLVAAYAAIRYAGLWGETDTNAAAHHIQAVLEDARVIPSKNVYPNGYGWPVLGAWLVATTGLSVAQMQIFGGALLSVWVVVPAWLAYRELTGSARGATLATVIVLVQPEFLFPILRGTHEKFTRGLMFLCLYLLVRSVISRNRPQRFAGLLLAFYLAIYAIITLNNLLATSFIVAIGLAFALSIAVSVLDRAHRDASVATRRRLLSAIGISLLLAFLFTFYAYPPAKHDLEIVQSMWDRLVQLFLGFETVSINPYVTVTTGWISLPVYMVVSIANWLLLGSSFILWLTMTITWWRQQMWPTDPRMIVLWSLCGAFGFLSALSIAVDVSGSLSANLQHRIFPSFAMVAAPLVASWLVHRLDERPVTRRAAYVGLGIVVAFLAIVAVAKATNEPLLSNKWQYYDPAEHTALDWSQRQDPYAVIWVEFDERLGAAMGICCNWLTARGNMNSFTTKPGTRNFLISDIIHARGERLDLPLPIRGDSLRVYDNGAAEIYHLRPLTPFQE